MLLPLLNAKLEFVSLVEQVLSQLFQLKLVNETLWEVDIRAFSPDLVNLLLESI